MELTEKEKQFAIDGSGLFFFNSKLSLDRKYEIYLWYKSLSREQQKYVDELRSEASTESDFFHDGD